MLLTVTFIVVITIAVTDITVTVAVSCYNECRSSYCCDCYYYSCRYSLFLLLIAVAISAVAIFCAVVALFVLRAIELVERDPADNPAKSFLGSCWSPMGALAR